MLQDTENNSTIELINLILISSCYKLFIFDKGIVLALAHPLLAKPFSLYLTLRHNEYTENGMSKKEVYKVICNGIKFVKNKDYKKV